MYLLDNTKITPFLITQIDSRQNEFLICSEELLVNKESFSKYLYGPIQKNKISDSFIRVFSFEKSIVLVYYWMSNLTEKKSNRRGLNLIFGLLIDKKYFSAGVDFAWYLNEYYEVLNAYCKTEYMYSDDIIMALTNNTQTLKLIRDGFKGIQIPIKRAKCWKINKRNISNRYTILMFSDGLYIKVKTFLNEVYSSASFGNDVSTHPNISPFSITVEYAEKYIMPKDVYKVEIVNYQNIKYLRIFYYD